MPTRTRTWIGVGLVCLAWLQGAGAQNAPGEDPVVLDRKVSIQMLPNGAAPRSGYMNPSSEMPAWQKARIARYEAKAFSGDPGDILTNKDVVSTATSDGFKTPARKRSAATWRPPPPRDRPRNRSWCCAAIW